MCSQPEELLLPLEITLVKTFFTMDPVITSALIGASGVLLGNVITLISQQNLERLSSMQRTIKKLRTEVMARQAEEKTACEWLVELGQATSEETLIKPRSSLQGGLNLIHETAAHDDSASLPLCTRSGVGPAQSGHQFH